MTTVREAFYRETTELLDRDPRTTVVLADISTDGLARAARAHPDRVFNVGIREQLMLSAAGGLALTGLRPIAHSYAPFVVERAWEQIKLDIDHQGVGAILVSVGASFDGSNMGRTHMSPGDVALLDTLDGWTVHVPGHADEVGPMLRAAARTDERVYIRLSTQTNAAALVDAATAGGLHPVRDGSRALIVAVGPMLRPTLAATDGLDVSVAYTSTPRPFDAAGLRALLPDGPVATVVLVEPYLAGTSSRVVADALPDVPHRLLALGVGRQDLHRYGRPSDHARAHGMDAPGLRRSITAFLP
jgi:transketolase